MRRSRVSGLVFIFVVVSVAMAMLPDSHACGPIGNRCGGPCPPELPICAKASNGACVCTNTWGDIDDGGPRMVGVNSSLAFEAILTGAEGGPSLFSVGNTVTVRQLAEFDVFVTHSPNWGSATQTIRVPALAASLTLKVTANDPGNPAVVHFRVVAFSGSLASFASVAINGDQTGMNLFSLRSDSVGFINTTTGRWQLSLYLNLKNGVFPGDPAAVQAFLSGGFNLSNRIAEISLATVNGDAVAIVADSPGENQQF